MGGIYYTEEELEQKISAKVWNEVKVHSIHNGDRSIVFDTPSEERELSANEFSKEFGIPNCVFVDGGLMSFKSTREAQDFKEYYHD